MNWDNEKLIISFLEDIAKMLVHYKKNPDELDGGYDRGVKEIFFDRFKDVAEQMGAVADIFDSPVEVVEKARTTGELVSILRQWPRNTGLVINAAGAIDNFPEHEYQWHLVKAIGPTSQELEGIKKHGNSFTVMDIDPEVVGG